MTTEQMAACHAFSLLISMHALTTRRGPSQDRSVIQCGEDALDAVAGAVVNVAVCERV